MPENALQATRMRRSPVATVLARAATRLPLREETVRWIARLEGGQMTSLSLRDYLRRTHGVVAGHYSYGSLLEPSMSDRGLTIGRYVSIGPNVRRFGAAHPIGRLSMHPYWYNPTLKLVGSESDVSRTECLIGHDAWIGANVTILPGCSRIGTGAIVGAGSIVTKDVPDFSIVVGNPARVRGERLTPELRQELITREPWLRQPSETAAILREIAAAHGDPRLFEGSSVPA